MAMSICFKCGSAKSGALAACRSCNAAPRTNSEYAVSLALSDHLSSSDQLAQYSYELCNGKKLSVPREALVQALDALKDPQLLAMLGVQPQPAASAPTSADPAPMRQPSTAAQADPQQVASISPPSKLTTTVLHQSAFAVLGVTTRDNRKRIVELAEEKSLELDHDVCQKARSDLTNPRTRLSAEIAWLPGVSPRKATQLVETCSTTRWRKGGIWPAHARAPESAGRRVRSCGWQARCETTWPSSSWRPPTSPKN
jgi:hypothetical protein